MKYVIGVDGGGTKTKAAAYTLDDKEIGKSHAGFGNLLLHFDKAVSNIIYAIEQCKSSINEQNASEECLCIYLGAAGMETGDYKEKLETLLTEKLNCKVQAFNDSVLAHAAIHKGEDGILTISGTGSISYGLYKGKKATTGGWGHILGDEGSGYYIALEAFKRITLEEDLGLVKSELTRTIMSMLNIEKANDMKEFIYSASKADIAAYTPIVVELAKSSELNSIRILKQAGKELALMTERLHKKIGINEPINIGIKGSVLANVDIVKEEFRNYFEINLPSVTIITEDISSTKGACYLHRRKENRCI